MWESPSSKDLDPYPATTRRIPTQHPYTLKCEEPFYSLKNTIKVLQQPTVGQLSQPRSPRMEGWEDKQRPQH